jgi:hypothetical protein
MVMLSRSIDITIRYAEVHLKVVSRGGGPKHNIIVSYLCATGGCLFLYHPPRLTLLKVMAQGDPMKNFGGNEMFAVFDFLKIRNSHR